MARQKYDETSIKMLFEYIQNLTDAMSVLKQEIEMLRDRVDIIETRSLEAQTSSLGLRASPELLKPPKVKHSRRSKTREPSNLQDELETVLSEGIRLKTNKEGKREELQEKHTAVYEEFKQLGIPKTQKEIYPAPPTKKSRWKKDKEKTDNNNEFPEDLELELERAFKSASRKKK